MSVFTFGAQLGQFGNWNGTLVTRETVAHFGELRSDGDGPSLPFRRLPFLHGGRRYEVPVVSGNSIRGVWRRLLSGDLLARLDLPVHELGPRVIYLLTSGGGLEGRDRSRRQRGGDTEREAPPAPEPVLKIGSKGELRSMLPMLGLLGACYGNSMLEGALRVGHAIPLCVVTAPLLGLESTVAVADLTAWTFYTRRDDRLLEGLQVGDRAKQQQIVRFESMAAGVILHHAIGVESATELEVSCLAHTLELFRARPFLGGKWASGSGRVAVHYPAVGDPHPYREWVAAHREELRAFLTGMEPVPRRRAG